jgi:hypothetical protein
MRLQPLCMLALCTLSLPACAPLKGPEVDLHELATPDPVPGLVRQVPQPPPGPPTGNGRWRAWIPRQVTSEGDATEGHWLDLRTDPPVVEVIEPVKPMPRAPKAHLGAPQGPPRPPAQTPAPSVPAVSLVPSGATVQEGLSTHQVQRIPLSRSPLGGP